MLIKGVLIGYPRLDFSAWRPLPRLAGRVTKHDCEVGIGRTTLMSGNNLSVVVDTKMLAAIMPVRRTGKPVAAG